MTDRPKVYYEPSAEYGAGFHCEGPDGTDFTLCGFSLDGDQGSIEEVTSAPPRIDCPRCLAVIRFCRDMPARAIGRSTAIPSQNGKAL
jgi:hypothetical protein